MSASLAWFLIFLVCLAAAVITLAVIGAGRDDPDRIPDAELGDTPHFRLDEITGSRTYPVRQINGETLDEEAARHARSLFRGGWGL